VTKTGHHAPDEAARARQKMESKPRDPTDLGMIHSPVGKWQALKVETQKKKKNLFSIREQPKLPRTGVGGGGGGGGGVGGLGGGGGGGGGGGVGAWGWGGPLELINQRPRKK